MFMLSETYTHSSTSSSSMAFNCMDNSEQTFEQIVQNVIIKDPFRLINDNKGPVWVHQSPAVQERKRD